MLFLLFNQQPQAPATTIRYGFPMFLFSNTQDIVSSIWTAQPATPGVWTPAT